MPFYDYQCKRCGHTTVEIRCVALRHNELLCDVCRAPMRLQIGAPVGIVKDPAVPKQRHLTK